MEEQETAQASPRGRGRPAGRTGVKTSFYLKADALALLAKLSERSGDSQAEILARLIRQQARAEGVE